jgi:hypothetical protein
MQFLPPVVARLVLVDSAACGNGASDGSGVGPLPENESAPALALPSTAARQEPDELGEVVQETSDSVWCVASRA